MKISIEQKFIFIHIPKTGGTTLTHALPGVDHNTIKFPHWHVNAKYISEHIDDYADYFSFAFVRNPWDRLYSIFRYNQAYQARYKQLAIYTSHGLNHLFECNFKTWLLEKSTWATWDKNKDYLPEQRQTQNDYLIDGDGNNIVSHVGRFENLSNEYTTICNKLNVPIATLGNLSKSTRLKDFRSVYDNEMIDFVYKKHDVDIKTFNYEFE